jgi:hypothetical protein
MRRKRLLEKIAGAIVCAKETLDLVAQCDVGAACGCDKRGAHVGGKVQRAIEHFLDFSPSVRGRGARHDNSGR